MNALGQKQSAKRHVRFTPESGHVQRTSSCLLWANSGHFYNQDFEFIVALPCASLRGISTSAQRDRQHTPRTKLWKYLAAIPSAVATRHEPPRFDRLAQDSRHICGGPP